LASRQQSAAGLLDMITASLSFPERSRKNHQILLKALSGTGQAVAANFMGVSESTVSRMKEGELDKLASLMAACGLKPVPIDMHCYPEAEIEALRILARRSDVLRPNGLEWED